MRKFVVLLLLAGCAPAPAPRSDPELADQSVSDERPLEVIAPLAPTAPSAAVSALPPPRTCRDALARAGVTFASAAKSPSIVDPIRLSPRLSGVVFRHEAHREPHDLWVDCRFAERLLRAATMLRERGVREVVHVGTYEPKCVGGGTPETRPHCTPSAHARGMAIDVVALVRERDTLSVERDFVQRVDDTPTCAMKPENARDAFLKELVCALDGTFSVLLTPNWDKRHRTHFHLALHPPAHAPTANGVDPLLASE